MASQLLAAGPTRRRQQSLWNRKNKAEQNIVKFIPKYAKLLREKGPALRGLIRHEELWAHFVKYRVMDRATEHRIRANITREDIVGGILDHIECGPSWRLHAFLRACSKTDQPHIISYINLDKEMYKGPSPPESESEDSPPSPEVGVHQPPSSSNPTGATSSSKGRYLEHQINQEEELRLQTLRQGLIAYCKYNKNNIMKARVFDFKHEDPEETIYNVVSCYIKQVPDLREYNRVTAPITMANILKPYGDLEQPTTVLLEGDPGTGKSTFNRCFTHHCSLQLLQYLDDKTGDLPSDQLLAVYIPATSLTSNIWGSVESSLRCKPEMRKVIMEQLKLGTFRSCYKESLLFDGIDEIRNQKVLDALKEFITNIHHNGGPQVLVSARTGLSRMNKSLFDRFLSLEGFTTSQGVEYTHRYITLHWRKQSVATNTPHPVLTYVDKNQNELRPILSNPLRTHLLSALAVEGLLEFNDKCILQPVHLLTKMEDFFIMRETEGEGVCPDEQHRFYKLCLYSHLADIQDFTEDHLQKFNVSTSAYLSFLRRGNRMEKNAKRVTYYSFEHEVLKEYFSARAIVKLPKGVKAALLMYICSKDIFRNLQKLIFSILGEYGGDDSLPLLTGMTRLLLLKQALKIMPRLHSKSERILIDFESNVSILQQNIDSSIPTPEALLLRQDAEHSRDEEVFLGMWEKVATAFDLFTELTNRTYTRTRPFVKDWVEEFFRIPELRVYGFNEVGFVRDVILDLLSDCPMQIQKEIASNTYYRNLPSDSIYACSCMRWMVVREKKIQCWSAEDLACNIIQPTHMATDKFHTDILTIDFWGSPSQWGHAPDDHWTSDAWSRALKALLSCYNVSRRVDIYLPQGLCTPLKGLLYSITQLDRSDFWDCGIVIHHGAISLEDLQHLQQASAATCKRKISLWSTTLHLPADREQRENLTRWLGEEFIQDVQDLTPDSDESAIILLRSYRIPDFLTLEFPQIPVM